MEHNYVRNDNFNILTIKVDKDETFILTGETNEGITIGDTINYIVNKKFGVLRVDDIVERRDNKDFPNGNNKFYKCICTIISKSN
jgi:hypothetical protein